MTFSPSTLLCCFMSSNARLATKILFADAARTQASQVNVKTALDV